MTTNLHPMLNIAIKAARSAGAIINRAALDIESIQISQKQSNDYVTEVDQASETTIINTLLTAYPGHAIWAEESGRQYGQQNSEYLWIIDPLDGTTNFIHGLPHYCISIALAVRNRVEQAVVYDPTCNDLFTASKGRGAYLNEKRIRVGKRTILNQCLVNAGFAYQIGNQLPPYLQLLAEIMPQTGGVRRMGAAALDLAYVAAGYSDAFFEIGLKPWDMAAGSLLVSEAGGLIGNYTGEAPSDFLQQAECLAANPKIYSQLVPILKKYSQY